MKIKYIIEDDLNAIKVNLEAIKENLMKKKPNTLESVLGKERVLRDTPYDISEFELDMSQPVGKESLTDLENIKRVYNNMRALSDSQASDERLWVAYTLGVFHSYMKYRWMPNSVVDIKNRYLFGYTAQRSLFRNGIARLWWIGRMTYDVNREDPYELTKFLCKDQDYIENICGRNVFNNPEIALTTIAALCDAEKAGKKVDRMCVRTISKYVNLLAGTYIIDAFSNEELYAKLKIKLGF